MRAGALLIALGISRLGAAQVFNAAGKRREITLENGLHVVLVRDDRRPRVAVAVSYKAGWRNDPEGYRGLSSVSTSLVFQGSRHIAENEITGTLERAGATSFGYAMNLEHAQFSEEMPARNYEVALWVESERMAFALDSLTGPAVDQTIAKINEGIHHNEGLSWVVNLELELMFPKPHPFHRGESHDDIGRIHLPEVQWFVQTHYRPDDATLVLVGDFELDDAERRVRRYFESIVTSRPPIPARRVPLTRLTGVHEWPSARTGSGFVLAWSFPGAGFREAKALTLVGECLTTRRLFSSESGEGAPSAPPVLMYRWRRMGGGLLFVVEVFFFQKKNRAAELRTLTGYLASLGRDAERSCNVGALLEQARRRYTLAESDYLIAARDIASGGTSPEEDLAQINAMTAADLEHTASQLAQSDHFVLELR